MHTKQKKTVAVFRRWYLDRPCGTELVAGSLFEDFIACGYLFSGFDFSSALTLTLLLCCRASPCVCFSCVPFIPWSTGTRIMSLDFSLDIPCCLYLLLLNIQYSALLLVVFYYLPRVELDWNFFHTDVNLLSLSRIMHPHRVGSYNR